MDTNVRTPQQIFMLPQHLLVPAFQRPYVWDEEEQWAPLWEDIRRLAELRANPLTANATHFLGAVVVQAQGAGLGGLSASNVIDGQQRITTLQLMIDAVGAALEARQHVDQSRQLGQLTHNDAHFVGGGSRLKLRQSNRDRQAFDAVMEADVPIDYGKLDNSDSRITRAHSYFSRVVGDWLETTSTDDAFRAQALASALMQGIQLVVIDLNAGENAQEIFETLNARGTPLDAADLIRNFVFQRLAARGANVDEHLAHWPFESAFWEKEVSVGRFPMQRSSLFFNQWLTARLREEVGPRATFARFKQYVEAAEREDADAMVNLLPVIRRQADDYQAWTDAAKDEDRQLSRVELTMYRLRASDVEVLKPLLIWLHEPQRSHTPAVIEAVLGHVESWLVRRQLLRLSLGDMGRVVVDLLRVHDGTPSAELASGIAGSLSRLEVSSTYWPGDAEIRESLVEERVFRTFKKGRLRMLLEAAEDHYRAQTNQPQVPRRSFPIEHILPQSWQQHWPVASPEEDTARAAHVDRLGNLTLLTKSLNSKVSNGPWKQKHAALKAHDTFLLNRRLPDFNDESWDETAIDARTEQLVGVLLGVWPVPEGHEGQVTDPHQKSAGWVMVKHLVAAGLLPTGTRLRPPSDTWGDRLAFVSVDGQLDVDGKSFDNPSGAAAHVAGSARNGWAFWRLDDGRKLSDVRGAYSGVAASGEVTGRVLTERWSASELHRLASVASPVIGSLIDHLSARANTPMSLEMLADAVGREPAGLNADFGAFTQRLRRDFERDTWPFAAVRAQGGRFVYALDGESAKTWRQARGLLPTEGPGTTATG